MMYHVLLDASALILKNVLDTKKDYETKLWILVRFWLFFGGGVELSCSRHKQWRIQGGG